MFEVTAAEILLGNSHLAVSLVRPAGSIVYENRVAREMLGHDDGMPASILGAFTLPGSWDEILAKLAEQGQLADEPVLLQTLHGDAELAYLTVLPQFDAAGRHEALLCVWAARRKALASAAEATNTGTLCEYTHDLEELLEHRTYQNLLAAEQNENARDALDLLSVGILIAAPDGQILYRNRAMSTDFGLRPAQYLQLTVPCMLEPAAVRAFEEVIATGLRRCLIGHDPGGHPAAIELLPLIRAEHVQKIILQFCHFAVSARPA